MRTVAVIPKSNHPEAQALAGRVAAWLVERGRAVLCETGNEVEGCSAVPARDISQEADLLVVLGGDGTLLHAARLCREREVPLLGVNMGTLGFMTDVLKEHVFEALEQVLTGEYRSERRTRLAVRVLRGDEVLLEDLVLNDVVISKNALARIANIDARVDGARLTTFNADGVIVATPTGSSAYSLAAGGPLVHPAVQAMLVVPICPHTLSQRPIVVPDDEVVELVLGSDSEMFVTLDGQSGMDLAQGDRVVVRRAAVGVRLVRYDTASHYALLRAKLRWGER